MTQGTQSERELGLLHAVHCGLERCMLHATWHRSSLKQVQTKRCTPIKLEPQARATCSLHPLRSRMAPVWGHASSIQFFSCFPETPGLAFGGLPASSCSQPRRKRVTHTCLGACPTCLRSSAYARHQLQPPPTPVDLPQNPARTCQKEPHRLINFISNLTQS